MSGNAFAAADVGKKQHRLDQAIAELRAADAAWRRLDTEFRAMRKAGNSPQTEVTEFADWVAKRQVDVFKGCRKVQELGASADQHGVECLEPDEQSGAEKETAALSDPSGPTRDQVNAELLAKLEQEFSEFDGMIKDAEQEQTAHANARHPGSREDDRDEDGAWMDGSGQDPDDARQDGDSREGSETKPTPGQEHGAGPGDGKVDVPEWARRADGDARDDDIVARQLREAAETEPDPALKEQLWEEYRKYKGSL